MIDHQQARTTYQKFAKYYDAYVAGFREDLPLYLASCVGAARILEIGCGTGRVLRPLLESGHFVCGVDISDTMLAIAADRLSAYLADGRLRLLNHDFGAAPLPERFQRILVTFYTFNYLTAETVACDFLANIRSSLEKQGLLLLDLFYPLTLSDPELNDQWHVKSFPVGKEIIQLRDKRVLRGNLEERTQQYTDPDGGNTEILTIRRYYSKATIFALLQGAGYRNIRFSDGYRMESFHSPADGEATTAGFCVAAEN